MQTLKPFVTQTGFTKPIAALFIVALAAAGCAGVNVTVK